MFNKIVVILVLLVLSMGILANVAVAQVEGGLVPDGGKKATGDYQLSDFTQIIINASKLILGVTGSLALLFFIYGGFQMIISAGNQESITRAKTILFNAVIGLAIIFTSALIIMFVEKSLKGQ